MQSSANGDRGERDERGRRGRRGGRGRGRDRDERRDREPVVASHDGVPAEQLAQTTSPKPQAASPGPRAAQPAPQAPPDDIGRSGELLRREEAFDLVRRAAAAMVQGNAAVPASALRRRVFDLLGRDSETLSERFFNRVLRDAHDADVIDLRRRGDDFEIALPAPVAPVAEQLNRAAAAHTPVTAPAPSTPTLRGMGPRGIPARGRGARGGPPPELLMVGVVETPSPAPSAATVEPTPAQPATAPAKGRARAKSKTKAVAAGGAEAKAPKKKTTRAPRAKKSAEVAEKA